MTDNENILLEKFFQEARTQEIADNGFTERVMSRLGEQQRTRRSFLASHFSLIWTWFCVAVFLALFFAFDGVQTVKTGVEVFFATLMAGEVTLQPLTLLLFAAFVAVYLPYQTARKLSAIQ